MRRGEKQLQWLGRGISAYRVAFLPTHPDSDMMILTTNEGLSQRLHLPRPTVKK